MKSHDLDMNRVSFEVTVRYPGKYLGHYRGGGTEQTNENEFVRNYGRHSQFNQHCKRKISVVGENIQRIITTT